MGPSPRVGERVERPAAVAESGAAHRIEQLQSMRDRTRVRKMFGEVDLIDMGNNIVQVSRKAAAPNLTAGAIIIGDSSKISDSTGHPTDRTLFSSSASHRGCDPVRSPATTQSLALPEYPCQIGKSTSQSSTGSVCRQRTRHGLTLTIAAFLRL